MLFLIIFALCGVARFIDCTMRAVEVSTEAGGLDGDLSARYDAEGNTK